MELKQRPPLEARIIGGHRLDNWSLSRPATTIGPLEFGSREDAMEAMGFWADSIKPLLSENAVMTGSNYFDGTSDTVLSYRDSGRQVALVTLVIQTYAERSHTLTIVNTFPKGPSSSYVWIEEDEPEAAGSRAPTVAEEVSKAIASIKGKVDTALSQGEGGTSSSIYLDLISETLELSGRLVDVLSAIREELGVSFTYRNHRGEVGLRRVRILGLRYGQSIHYTEPQWLLRAWCYDRRAERDFSLAKILEFIG